MRIRSSALAASLAGLLALGAVACEVDGAEDFGDPLEEQDDLFDDNFEDEG